jgi:zinc protease
MSWTAGVIKRVLPNGLTLLIQRVEAARVVAVVTHVKAGYFDEPDEWVGISHVLEHMFFKGTARRGPGTLAREIQLAGGYLNASTIYDKTVYYTVLPAAEGALARAVALQAEALTAPALDAEELARELEVIIQEVRRKLDHPRAVLPEALYQALFTVHPMRRWRIGTEEGLRRLTAQDLHRYHATRYTPARTIVAMVGHLDPDHALRLGEDAYGSWSVPPAALPPLPQEPETRRAAFRLLRGDIQRPLAAIGWRTVGALHPDAVPLDAAAALVGSGRGSRLFRLVRLPALAAQAAATHYTPTDVGVFAIELEASADRLDQAVRRSLALTADLASREPAALELERVRALLEAQWAHHLESMDARAQTLCSFEALGDYRLADEFYQRALAVTADQVRAVAAQYLVPAVASAVVYLPPAGETALENQWPPAVEAAPASLPGVEPSRPARRSGSCGSREVYPGDITYLASGGTHLVVRPQRGSGLVALSLYLPGLRDQERAATAGHVSWMLRAALRGAGTWDAEALAFAAELLGGTPAPVAGADGAGWSLTVPASYAGPAAELLRCLALEPTLSDDALERERALMAHDAARMRDDMLRYPLQRVLRGAFGEDPYGQPVLGEPESVLGLAPALARDAAERLRAGRPLVVAVGDLAAGELLECLAPLAEWPAGGHPWEPAGPPAWSAGSGVEVRDKAQTALAWAFPAPGAASPERWALEVLGAVLAGMAGRLFEALRERRPLVYTATAMPWLRRRGGAFLAYTATSPEREAEARDAMLEELVRVAREPVQAGELERARQYAAGLVDIRRQHVAYVASELVDACVAGTLDAWAELPRRLRSVSAEELLQVAAAVFAPDRRAEYVVRGSAKSAPLVAPVASP